MSEDEAYKKVMERLGNMTADEISEALKDCEDGPIAKAFIQQESDRRFVEHVARWRDGVTASMEEIANEIAKPFLPEHKAAAKTAAIQALNYKQGTLEHHIEELEAGLKFYADGNHWREGLACMGSADIIKDYGRVAREALANKDKEVELSEPPFCAWCGGTCECDPEYSDQEVEQDDSKD